MRSLLAALLLVSSPALAADLSGQWEVQTMGADREMKLQQKGNKLVAHRVMWPEFDGEKYKLEHLYRGTLSGNTIKGDLLVKEEELPRFEVLRSFTGSIGADGSLILDGMPMKRLDGAGDAKVATPEPVAPDTRPSEPPTLSQQRPSDVPLAQTAPAPEQPAEADPGASLFANIMGSPGGEDLLRVSASITMPNEAQALTEEGDALLAKRKPKLALKKFEAAQKIEGGSQVGLLHRIGRCHLALERYSEARDALKRALRLDPSNTALKQDYEKAKAKA